VLITPTEVQVGLSEHLRSGMVVVNSGSDQAKRWFHFPPNVDFARCMPADQQPKIEKGGKHAAGPMTEKKPDRPVAPKSAAAGTR
jgi:hypothetical protein